MKILIDNSSYALANHGDVAMLQVAVQRLRERWPDARLDVITTATDKLMQLCPSVNPVPLRGRQLWLESRRLLPQKLTNALERFAAIPISRLEFSLEKHHARLHERWTHRRAERLGKAESDAEDYAAFYRSLMNADLVLATGGGYLTDAFQGHAISIMTVLGAAQALGKPTVMVGQGLGPFNSASLARRARLVLPRLELIFLREKVSGAQLLRGCGVSENKIVVTGDDAVEMAYSAHPAGLGNATGINVRLAEYSGVTERQTDQLRPVLHEFAASKMSPLTVVPISFHKADSDVRAGKLMTEGYCDVTAADPAIMSPKDTILRVGTCRIMVTGSYHAGLFALSQGITVIGLANTGYYIDKFRGLSDQFGAGCSTVRLDSPNLKEDFRAALDLAWQSAPSVRESLLSAARQQIETGHEAYRRIFDLPEQ